MVGGETFSPLAPILGPEKKGAMSTSSPVHGGQYDNIPNTWHVILERMVQAVFVGEGSSVVYLELTRVNQETETYNNMLPPRHFFLSSM